jgi:hypothetical protein
VLRIWAAPSATAPATRPPIAEPRIVLIMICTTSGLGAQRDAAAKVTWVDIKPRAVAIARKAT